MAIHLYRIDDRLIHGQVVVGWGQPLNARFLILVDDLVASSDWEKELYRMAVPPEMDSYFANVHTAIRDPPDYAAAALHGILVAGANAARSSRGTGGEAKCQVRPARPARPRTAAHGSGAQGARPTPQTRPVHRRVMPTRGVSGHPEAPQPMTHSAVGVPSGAMMR